MSFEAQLLRAVSHSEGVTAGSLATAAFSGATVTLNDPIWEVLINGNTDASVAPTGLVQLATLALEVQPGATGMVTFIQAKLLVGLVTCSQCDDTDDNSSDGLDKEMGGSGYVLLPGGRRRRGLRLSEVPQRAATASVGRALAQPDGSCCGSSVGVDAFYGDINGDCVFDIKDVRRASLLLLSQQSGSTDVPTEYQGVAMCPWQQQQLDPTLDGAFMSNDAVYLLLVLSRKYRFVVSATLALAPRRSWTSRRHFSTSAAPQPMIRWLSGWSCSMLPMGSRPPRSSSTTSWELRRSLHYPRKVTRWQRPQAWGVGRVCIPFARSGRLRGPRAQSGG